MQPELQSLRIDRTQKRSLGPSEGRSVARWILAMVALLLLLCACLLAYSRINTATEVELYRVKPPTSDENVGRSVILNATGYIIAAHKIEVAPKVLGKVAWIGVEKGDPVRQGQVVVRLEDDEYRAMVLQAEGNLDNLKAKLAELEHGSRPEEIARAKADVDSARSDLENYRVTLERTRKMVESGIVTRQSLGDDQAKHDNQLAKVASLQRTYELSRLGPRQEQIDALRAQVKQAQGNLDYAKIQLSNTIIHAPVTGTILERNVEKGEFVTTGFVGDKGAKGYVVSLADLDDLEVELDINQNDFARLDPKQPGTVTTDAYPDRKYEGYICEISPEANRQKATVQVKVKITNPNEYLRPDMNASVSFYNEGKTSDRSEQQGAQVVVIPQTAIRDGGVFVSLDGRALRKPVTVAGTTAAGVQISSGLIGGEDVILNPPADLKDGQRVLAK
jgi:HlyD family secretion protein